MFIYYYKVHLICFALIASGLADLYHIKPKQSTKCLDSKFISCLTLTQFSKLQNVTKYTNLVLLPGNHVLESNFSIHDIVSLTISSKMRSKFDMARITCSKSNVMFTFGNIERIIVKGLDILGCTTVVNTVDNLKLEDSRFDAIIGLSSGIRNQAKEASLLSVNFSKGVVISNCSFANNAVAGNSSHGGALVFWSSAATLDKVAFVNNTVTEAGGALGVVHSLVNITSSIFTNNSVVGEVGQGGAVFAISSSLTLKGCSFAKNYVKAEKAGNGISSGGAIAVQNCTIFMTRCNFTDNFLQGGIDGGAIFGISCQIYIKKSEFYGNNIVYNRYTRGGALSIAYSYTTVNKSKFISNIVSGGYSHGGAIVLRHSISSVHNSIFTDSAVNGEYAGSGGAISTMNTTCICNSNMFSNNIVTGSMNVFGGVGGAISAINGTLIVVNNGTFTNNSVSHIMNDSFAAKNKSADNLITAGGALFWHYGIIMIHGSLFTDNAVTGSTKQIGGAATWFQNTTSVVIYRTKFLNNDVSAHGNFTYSKGGAIFAIVYHNIVINSCYFSENTLSGEYSAEGGAVCIKLYKGTTIIVFGSKFVHNTVHCTKPGHLFGGAISVSSSKENFHDISIRSCEFDSNIITGYVFHKPNNNALSAYGGAVFIFVMLRSVDIDNCSFANNTATGHTDGGGGAMYVVANSKDQKHTISIHRCAFTNNIAIKADKSSASGTVQGGAIFITASNIDINSSTFSNNAGFGLTAYGGAIYVKSKKPIISIVSCVFTNNIVMGYAENLSNVSFDVAGGAIVINSHFDSVIANHGGAVNNIRINNSKFHANLVTGDTVSGGAILLIIDPKTMITVSNCDFVGNNLTANNGTGGALNSVSFKRTSRLLIILNSVFSANVVNAHTGTGGAVNLYGNSAHLNSTTFINNSLNVAMSGVGGAVYFSGNIYISIVMCTFRSNEVNRNNRDSNKMFESVNGMSVAEGGAISCGYSFVSIKNSTFTNNVLNGHKSCLGGAIVTFTASIVVNNSTFTSNKILANCTYGSGGAVFVMNGTTINTYSTMFINNTVAGKYGASGGAMTFLGVSTMQVVVINSCKFSNNSVMNLFTRMEPISNRSKFHTIELSFIGTSGGAIYNYNSATITINNCTFSKNSAKGTFMASCGALLTQLSDNVTINQSLFTMNSVAGDSAIAGAFFAISSLISISQSVFTNNNVAGGSYGSGGALWILMSVTNITNSTVNKNVVTGEFAEGGAVYYSGYLGKVQDNFRMNCFNCSFNFNTITGKGAAIYIINANMSIKGNLQIHNNTAHKGVLFAIQGTFIFSGITIVANNYGSLIFSSCNVLLRGITSIFNNSFLENISDKRGGSLTLFQSKVEFIGGVYLRHNVGNQGGAISITETELRMSGSVVIDHNMAKASGGGIYAYQSVIYFIGTINISRNTAGSKGGGVHVVSSTTIITTSSTTIFMNNHALWGGGMCLEFNAKIYIVKTKTECIQFNFTITSPEVDEDLIKSYFHYNYYSLLCTKKWTNLEFVNNSAEYHGGALYVNDTTNVGSCFATPFEAESAIHTECFLQALSVYTPLKPSVLEAIGIGAKVESFHNFSNLLNIYFNNNSAKKTGGTLYGGLIDRCSISPLAEFFVKYIKLSSSSVSTLSYIFNITNLTVKDINSTKVISSEPVRICVCKNNIPNCSYQPQLKPVYKGELFPVPLVAVDQINNTVPNVSIHCFLSQEANLTEGQSLQWTNKNGTCTNLLYSIHTPRVSEKLHIYAGGPCEAVGISVVSFTVDIAPCPIGFNDTNLHCECDSRLFPEYISNCFVGNKTVQRKGNVWFAFVNITGYQTYVLYFHCPFDYCHSPTENVYIDLNIPDGADEMCALNHSGKLCGACKNGLSLSLGSSLCKTCHNNNITSIAIIIIVFVVAGICLVSFLLLCNLTVAVGTINSLIFYANIFAANRSVFLPFQKTSVLTVFIAWLNLDLGFEVCFYDGMDSYIKTWLQFAFPLYVITLVILVIVISEYSFKFAALLRGKNPVATLSTLILLSYTKLIRTIITTLSSATLKYSNDSHSELVWLADGNIPYLRGKHIPLFLTAVLVVIIGLTYTSLLLGWQWLVCCPNKGPMKWIIGNTKVIAFMDAYHNPFTKHHRYWIGLLLLVRVLLYLVSAVNVFGDPRINLLSINTAIIILLCFRHTAGYKHNIHKRLLTFTLETITLLNLVGLASITFYITESKKSQVAVSYVSMSLAFVSFLAILMYHSYTFVLKKAFQRMLGMLSLYCRTELTYSSLADDTTNDEQELMALGEASVTVVEFPEPLDTDEEDIAGSSETSDIDVPERHEQHGIDESIEQFYCSAANPDINADPSNNFCSGIELKPLQSGSQSMAVQQPAD